MTINLPRISTIVQSYATMRCDRTDSENQQFAHSTLLFRKSRMFDDKPPPHTKNTTYLSETQSEWDKQLPTVQLSSLGNADKALIRIPVQCNWIKAKTAISTSFAWIKKSEKSTASVSGDGDLVFSCTKATVALNDAILLRQSSQYNFIAIKRILVCNLWSLRTELTCKSFVDYAMMLTLQLSGV